ncbi:Lectin galactoside-binding soluble 3 [Parelaphostrongylus tenuis]|uniref:Galectin n=1 Tax=Parelaphostrongylus tenuis TaxID=148309 RepID=A0AAD5R4W3_PARTN|nr:Lectin galactoside-binding soluble 3 [Parelaphostrongylus tenuis]
MRFPVTPPVENHSTAMNALTALLLVVAVYTAYVAASERCVKRFPGGNLCPGQKITLYASPTPNAKKFTVDFLGEKGSDILLHFNPRFEEKLTVLNSYQGGQWKQQINEPSFPYKEGQGFKLVFNIQDDAVGIIVDDNDQSKISFKHRSDKPDEYICMSVSGDLNVFALEIE